MDWFALHLVEKNRRPELELQKHGRHCTLPGLMTIAGSMQAPVDHFPKCVLLNTCPTKALRKQVGAGKSSLENVSLTCYCFWRITMRIGILCSESRKPVHAVQPTIFQNLEPHNPFVESGVTVSISLIYYLPQNAQIPLRGLMHRMH